MLFRSVTNGTSNRIDNLDINTGKVLYSYTGLGQAGNIHSLAVSPAGELIGGLHEGGIGITAFKISSATTEIKFQPNLFPTSSSLDNSNKRINLPILDASGRAHSPKTVHANDGQAPRIPEGIYFVQPKNSSITPTEKPAN